jgi:hypothetical protein
MIALRLAAWVFRPKGIFGLKLGWALFIVVLCGLKFTACSFSQSNDPQYSVATLAGEVVSIDFKASTFVLRTPDKKEFTFVFPLVAKIFKGSERIDFSRLEKHDEVTIIYLSESVDIRKVMRITVENPIE